MRRLALATLAFALSTTLAAHAGSIVYTINQTISDNISSATITGTITTDGALGALSSSDVTDVNINVAQSELGFLFANGSVNQVSIFTPDPDAITATVSGLFFDFSGSGSFVLLGNAALQYRPGFESFSGLGLGVTRENMSGNVEIASVAPAVPEPSSLMLLGTGVLSLAGAARHKFLKA